MSPRGSNAPPTAWSRRSSSSTAPARCSCSAGWTTRRSRARSPPAARRTGAAAGRSTGSRARPPATGQWVRRVQLDCDGDALLVTVDQEGPACHTGDGAASTPTSCSTMAESRRTFARGRSAPAWSRPRSPRSPWPAPGRRAGLRTWGGRRSWRPPGHRRGRGPGRQRALPGRAGLLGRAPRDPRDRPPGRLGARRCWPRSVSAPTSWSALRPRPTDGARRLRTRDRPGGCRPDRLVLGRRGRRS